MSIISGLLSDKKTAGSDSGNYLGLSSADQESANSAFRNLMNYQGNSAAIDPIQSSRTATSEVQNNGILGGLFGKSGTLNQALSENQNLSSQGYQLQPQDKEAYGQASDNIARQYAGAQGNLAQALASRGLSNSGVAGRAFMTSQGNKMEQLAQIQTQIANDRMNNNMQRLAQTRSFISSLGNQAEGAIQGQFGRQLSSEQQNFGEAEGKNQGAYQRLNGAQQQANQQFSQRQSTQQTPGWAQALGTLGGYGEQMGMMAAGNAIGGAGGAGGGANAGGTNPYATQQRYPTTGREGVA